MGEADVIVVGAGIAGLAAAHALQRAGRRVVTLEASDAVGGRMRSIEHDGCMVDLGAQFISAGYDTLHALAGEVGVAIAPLSTPYSAILRDGCPLRLRAQVPSDAVIRGLLSPWQALRYGWRLLRASGRRTPGDLADYACWARQDDESAADWLARHDLMQVGRVAIEPLLEGLYFQQPETTSKAMLLMVAAFTRRGHPNQCFVGDMGALPRALSRGRMSGWANGCSGCTPIPQGSRSSCTTVRAFTLAGWSARSLPVPHSRSGPMPRRCSRH